jgi:predicted nucleic acid-binding protein
VQIDQIELLPRLFGRVLIPTVVAQELRHPSAPAGVQSWMKELPQWLEISPQADMDDAELNQLDPGEKSASALGISVNADLILIDERKGAAAATGKGLATTGTIGVLDLAAERGLIDLRSTLELLKKTNFRYRQTMLDELIEQRERRSPPAGEDR